MTISANGKGVDNRAKVDLTISVSPIGFIRSAMRVNFEAPHQPVNASTNGPRDGTTDSSMIQLLPGHRFEQALQDLRGFERIWLIWWADRNERWRPLVLPPRGKMQRRGVFPPRSPHRPNSICMSAVPLLSIAGLEITVGSCDLLDGTPILDIKPYIPTIDAFPGAIAGWVTELETELQSPPGYRVTVAPLAETQLNWLEQEWGIVLLPRARELLERDPSPHRSRRIGRFGKDQFRMGCGPWRLIFSIQSLDVIIESVARGFPERSLLSDEYTRIPDREAQIAFGEIWKQSQRSPI